MSTCIPRLAALAGALVTVALAAAPAAVATDAVAGQLVAGIQGRRAGVGREAADRAGRWPGGAPPGAHPRQRGARAHTRTGAERAAPVGGRARGALRGA